MATIAIPAPATATAAIYTIQMAIDEALGRPGKPHFFGAEPFVAPHAPTGISAAQLELAVADFNHKAFTLCDYDAAYDRYWHPLIQYITMDQKQFEGASVAKAALTHLMRLSPNGSFPLRDSVIRGRLAYGYVSNTWGGRGGPGVMLQVWRWFELQGWRVIVQMDVGNIAPMERAVAIELIETPSELPGVVAEAVRVEQFAAGSE